MVTSDGIPFETEIEWVVAIPSILIALAGIIIAWVFYGKKSALPDRLAATFKNTYRVVYNKFYIDEIYLFITKKIIFRYISVPVAWFDRHIVDGTMNTIAQVTQVVSFRIRYLQSGQLQKYAFAFISGVIMLALLLIYLWR